MLMTKCARSGGKIGVGTHTGVEAVGSLMVSNAIVTKTVALTTNTKLS